MSYQIVPRVGHLALTVCGKELPLVVRESPAGFFIGTVNPDGCPCSRESQEYFPTQQAAEAALETDEWTQLELSI